MPTTTSDPSLTTLTEAMWPLMGLLRKTSFTRSQNLASIDDASRRPLNQLANEPELEVNVRDLDPQRPIGLVPTAETRCPRRGITPERSIR